MIQFQLCQALPVHGNIEQYLGDQNIDVAPGIFTLHTCPGNLPGSNTKHCETTTALLSPCCSQD